MRKLPTSLTTVTTFSKLLAMFLFILFPFVGFYMGRVYQQKLDASEHLVTTRLTSNQPTQDNHSWNTYTNTVYGFFFDYPSSLQQYLSEGDKKDSVFIGYPGPSLGPLFSIDTFPTTLDAKTWWGQVGSKKIAYQTLTNVTFHSVIIVSQTKSAAEIQATQVTGQIKTPGGAVLPQSIDLISHNGFLFVVKDNSEEYPVDNKLISQPIINTFRWIDKPTLPASSKFLPAASQAPTP